MMPTDEQKSHPSMRRFAAIWGWEKAIELLWPGLKRWEILTIAADINHGKVG
jgi:hypothetical protein